MVVPVVSGQKKPAGQAMGAELPAGQKEPPWQSVGVPVPLPQKVPSGHWVAEVEPLGQKKPSGQVVQSDCDVPRVEERKEPATQSRGARLALGQYLPAGQGYVRKVVMAVSGQ